MKDPDDVFGDGARFIRNAGGSDPNAKAKRLHPQQMAMDSADRRETYGPAEFGSPPKHPWAHTVQERPRVQHEQPSLFEDSPHPSTIPTDPDLHRIRQANPKLNDFQFKTHVNPHGAASVSVYHPTTGLVGELATHPIGETSHREIDMIETHPSHRGKGIAEGMYDIAQARGGSLLHSDNRSEHGEAFARRVGGAKKERTKGLDVDKYMGSMS